MHRLHLLRHAKSGRDEGLDDHERQLSRSGRDDARRVAESLPAALGRVDLVLCSTSLRTRETAALVLTAFVAAPRTLYEDALCHLFTTRVPRRCICLPQWGLTWDR